MVRTVPLPDRGFPNRKTNPLLATCRRQDNSRNHCWRNRIALVFFEHFPTEFEPLWAFRIGIVIVRKAVQGVPTPASVAKVCQLEESIQVQAILKCYDIGWFWSADADPRWNVSFEPGRVQRFFNFLEDIPPSGVGANSIRFSFFLSQATQTSRKSETCERSSCYRRFLGAARPSQRRTNVRALEPRD